MLGDGPSRAWLSKPSLISLVLSPAGEGMSWGGVAASSSSAASLSEAAGLVPVYLSVRPSPFPHSAEPSRVKGQAWGWGEFTLPLPPEKTDPNPLCLPTATGLFHLPPARVSPVPVRASHSFTPPFIHSSIHSLIHAFTHSFIHSSMHPLNND